jgi:hypothetical protein
LKDFDEKSLFINKRVGYNVRKVNKVNAVYNDQKDLISICTAWWVEVNGWWRTV